MKNQRTVTKDPFAAISGVTLSYIPTHFHFVSFGKLEFRFVHSSEMEWRMARYIYTQHREICCIHRMACPPGVLNLWRTDESCCRVILGFAAEQTFMIAHAIVHIKTAHNRAPCRSQSGRSAMDSKLRKFDNFHTF